MSQTDKKVRELERKRLDRAMESAVRFGGNEVQFPPFVSLESKEKLPEEARKTFVPRRDNEAVNVQASNIPDQSLLFCSVLN